MEVISKIVEKMIEPIIERLYTSIGRRFGYLVHCKKNIQDFADEVDKLRATKAIVEIKVGAARDNAEVIHDYVSKWQRDVQSMEDDKSRLLQGKDNLKCLDVCSRYRLGKEGKKKQPDVTKLIADGNNFGDVGHQRPLPVTFQKTYSINYKSFQSREIVFEEIMEALKDDGTYKIGIHGMPGVGKTRMMEEVAQHAQKESLFHEVAEIVVSQNPILTDIQQKLAKSLNMKEPEKASKARICHRLGNGKKILVMVDDVWNNEIKLEDIGIPAADNHTKGCKIILTSRIKDECLRMGVQKDFEIGLLSEHEALKLFNETVGDFTECPELHELHSIAKEVCNECDRLPLAIVTVGAALRYVKERHAWKNALEQLKHCKAYNIPGVSNKLHSCIELSYTYLKLKDLQQCFLHCCLFPEDAEISTSDLVTYGVGVRFLENTDRASMEKARDRTRTLIDTLKKFNLLLNGSDENFVKMHDVIRDVAISIASKDKDAMFLVQAGVEKWPDEDGNKQCKAISLRFNDDCVLPDDSECTETCTLMLEFPNFSSKVPSSFFKGMEKLQVLQLQNMQISELPSSLRNLRMLRLYNCNLVNVAFLKEFKKLEILCIGDSDLKELAPEIGRLKGLRLLDARYCYNLKIIPSGVISSLSQLEELYIPDEFDQWVVKDNANLNELNSLKRLISLQVFVPDVVLLPLIEPLFKSLIRFQISIGSCFDYRHSATRMLKLDGFPIKKELNILMEKAEVLLLENLPNGLCGSGSFSKLTSLEVVNCKLMIYLFSSATARNLLQLQELTISGCEIMEEIVRDDEEAMDTVIIFHHLKKIELEDLPKLRSFYAKMKKSTTRGECNTSTLVQALFNHKVRFPALEKLKIENLKSLTAIWDNQLCPGSEGQDSFQLLRLIHVKCSEKLVNVIPPNAIPMLHNLESLEIVSCDSIVSGVEMVAIEEGDHEILIFPQLKNLKLQNLSNLKRFCYSTGGSEEQEEECGGKILVFSQLRTMRLEDLPKLSSFCCSRRGGEELVVEESNIDQRKALFNHKVKIPCLEELFMKNLDNLEEIQVITISTDSISKLRKLELEWCRRLLNVASTELHTSFQNLEEVEVLQCASLQEVFKVEGSKGAEGTVLFPQVRTMRLEDLPKLSSFCCSTRGGEELVVEESNIPQQQALFNNKVRFPALEELKIKNLKSLMAIWDNQLCPGSEGQDSFQLLRLVHVECSEKLVNVIPPNAIPMLHNLESLEIVSCDSVVSGVELVAIEEGDDEILMFPQLKNLKLQNLSNLKRFCYSTGGSEEQQEECGGQILVFSQLRTMRLEDLPKLSSFCCSRRGGEELVVEESNIDQRKALFNHKVKFPCLEELFMEKLDNLEEIWYSTISTDSVSKLRKLELKRCRKLLNVASTELHTSFQNLEEVKVLQCESLREVFKVEGSKGAEGTVLFPQVRTMRLEDLPKLSSFCCSTRGGEELVVEESNIPQQQALFNNKVRFPALEELKIKNLKSLMAIWDNQLCPGSEGQDSFQLLRLVHVECSEKLVNVIPPNAIPMLHNLESLEIVSCDSVVSGVELVAIEEGDDEILMFPQLKNLKLQNLSNLKRFCYSTGGSEEQQEECGGQILVFSQLRTMRLEDLPKLSSFCCSRRGGEELVVEESNIDQRKALFNHKVKFPCLEELFMEKLDNLEEIWYSTISTDSVSKLRKLELKRCRKLLNVASTELHTSFQNLEEVKVLQCESLREVFKVEGSKGAEGTVLFPQVRTMRLEDLPKLSSFCCSTRGGEELVVEESNIPQQQALFNNKVRFPALEELKIKNLKSLMAIWDNQLCPGSEGQDSFQLLRLVHVECSEKLVNVIPPNAIPMLHNLESLEIVSCDSVVSGVELVAIEEGDDEILMFPQLKNLKLQNLSNLKSFCYSTGGSKEEQEECNGKILVFSQLRTMRLEDLPKLSSFCCSRRGGEELVVEESNIPQQQALFNNKVAFFALEKLSITNLESLEAIWNDQSQSLLLNEAKDSFQFLKCIEVNGCNKVVNVIPANVLPRLQNLTQLHISKRHNLINVFSSSMAKYLVHLQKLKVTDCEKMEEIVEVERGLLREDGEEDLGHDEIIVFHKLKHLTLQQLPNLNNFCSIYGSEKEEETAEQNFGKIEALFNYKVRFPALEELEIGKLQSLRVIWDKQLFLGSEPQNSFRQLRFVTVHECDKLVNVIPSNAFPMLQNLESLKVVSCDSMVYGAEVAAIEGGSDEILMFPQLKNLKLKKLPNLKSFCYSNIGGSKEEEEEEGGGGKTLVFPQLNTVRLKELPKLSGICCSRRGGEETVLKESDIPQQQADLFNYKVEFPMLETLVLGDGSIFGGIWKICNKVRFMEVKKYIDVVNACTLLQWSSLEFVEELRLESCESLEVIFNLEGLGAIERKAIVSSQAKTLRLRDLPKLERIWIMESQGLLVFHNLTSLEVVKCNSLRYVFSLSIARGLTQLRELWIGECSVMEEIVRSEGQGEEDDMEEIVFSRLKEIVLEELPKLTCFCGTNNAFNFPSLKWVWLEECPKLQTFTSGGISTSGGITMYIDVQEQRDVSDLNSHVQRRLVGKGKESEEDDDE